MGMFLIGKAADAGALFDTLKIALSEEYNVHLNRHSVVYIDFSRMSRTAAVMRRISGAFPRG